MFGAYWQGVLPIDFDRLSELSEPDAAELKGYIDEYRALGECGVHSGPVAQTGLQRLSQQEIACIGEKHLPSRLVWWRLEPGLCAVVVVNHAIPEHKDADIETIKRAAMACVPPKNRDRDAAYAAQELVEVSWLSAWGLTRLPPGFRAEVLGGKIRSVAWLRPGDVLPGVLVVVMDDRLYQCGAWAEPDEPDD